MFTLNSRPGELKKSGSAASKRVTITVSGWGGMYYTEEAGDGVKKRENSRWMQDIQGKDAAKDTHLQSFQCGWSCVAALEGIEITYKVLKMCIISHSSLVTVHGELWVCIFTCSAEATLAPTDPVWPWGSSMFKSSLKKKKNKKKHSWYK